MENDEKLTVIFAELYKDHLSKSAMPWWYSWKAAKQDFIKVATEEYDQETALEFVENFIDNPDSYRRCSECGKPVIEGFTNEMEYWCSNECLYASYDGCKNITVDVIAAQIDEDLEQDIVYYTEWESCDFFWY